MKILALVLISLFATQTNGSRTKSCGDKLTVALWDACGEKFNSLPLGKRAVHPRFIAPAIQNALSYPYIPGSLSDIFLLEEENFADKNRRARMIGVVNECCLNGCTYEQLSNYC